MTNLTAGIVVEGAPRTTMTTTWMTKGSADAMTMRKKTAVDNVENDDG